MAQPVTAAHARRIELPLREVRSRLSQLVRMAGITGQVTVVVEEGRALAEIRPLTPAGPDRPPGPELRALPDPGRPPELRALPDPGRAGPAPEPAPAASAAGWLRRLDKVRDDLRRQHATREAELVDALNEAWRLLDEARPPGTDRPTDTLRGAHRPLRQPPASQE